MGNFTLFSLVDNYCQIGEVCVCVLIIRLILQAEKKKHKADSQKERKVIETDCQTMLCLNIIEKIECTISNWLET